MALSIAHAGKPLSELNTTPLIDVLLVLLVMFIVTIPVASHSLTIALPVACMDNCTPLNTIRNRLSIAADGSISWNDRRVSEAQLRNVLARSLALPVEPQLEFEPDANASYAQSARIINLVRQAGVTRFGFVGNERYRSFSAH